MSKDRQARAARWPGAAVRSWVLPLLAVALAFYVLWMGQTLAWSQQHSHYWFFLAPWWTATSVKFLAISLGLAAGLHFGGARVRRWLPAALAAWLLWSQWTFTQAAWGVVGGTVPWGFDHPSFMYRLKEFGELFPFALGGYNPGWNAGTEHFVGVTSGAHGFGVLIWPLLKLWQPHAFYGAALIFWFVWGFPWLGAAAVRSAGAGRAGALLAGMLMCGVNREFFVWMWHFGTVGAMTSAMMAVPVVALGYRLAVLRRGSWGTALALGVAAWLMCLWTPGVFIGAGLGLGWLWNARRWTWGSNRWLFAAGALALALLAPWFWTTWFPCRNVLEHVGTALERPGWSEMALNGADRLWVSFQEWHPVVLFFGLLGTAVAAPRGMRRWMLPVFLVLGAVAGWSRELKPFSQLERMAIPLAAVAVFPAAVLGGRLFGAGGPGIGGGRARRWPGALAQGIVLATVLFGFRSVRVHYSNHGHAPQRTLSAEVMEIAEWIRAEVSAEGRLGIAGRAAHFFGGGNCAYLPVLTGREMMADDYYGFPRGTIEFNYPPEYYRREIDRYRFFTRAHGITHWAAVMPDAQRFLASQPDHFELARTWQVLDRTVAVFRVKESGEVSRFWEGSGRVEARENRLEVFPADPSAERVVIRYNWRAGLVCRTPGAAIEPVAVDENIRFIAVKPGGNGRVEIGYRPHWAPVKPNFDGRFHH